MQHFRANSRQKCNTQAGWSFVDKSLLGKGLEEIYSKLSKSNPVCNTTADLKQKFRCALCFVFAEEFKAVLEVAEMGIRILDLEADQYFFVRDRHAEQCLENAYSLAESLNPHRSRPNKAEAKKRDKLKDNLSDVLGYRRAPEVAELDPDEIFEILREEAIRQGKFRAAHLNLFHDARDNAKRKYSDWKKYAEGELKIDAIYHTTERMGIGRISEMFGGPGGMEITERLYMGERLLDLVNRKVISVMKALPTAIFFADDRQRLCEILSDYGLDDVQISEVMRIVPYDQKVDETVQCLTERLDVDRAEVKKALQTYVHLKGRFERKFEAFANLKLRGNQREEARKIMLNSLKRGSNKAVYAKAVRQLLTGDLNLQYVLDYIYRPLDWYPLVGVMQDLQLRELPVSRFHTNVAKDVAYFLCRKYSGEVGIPRELLKLLQNLAEMEVEVSRWSSYGGYSVLYPTMEIRSSILGSYYGLFCLGHGNFATREYSEDRKKLTYALAKRGENSILQYLEEIGRVAERPSVCQSTENCLMLQVPFHYHDLVTQIPRQEFNNEDFARSALSRWVEERSWRRPGVRGYYAYIRLQYEEDMRRLANKIGLSVSAGHLTVSRRTKLVYIRNPNILALES